MIASKPVFIYNLIEFDIMESGITPKAQPIDAITEKLYKGYNTDFYYECMMIVC